ncbi:PRA1 family protein 3-like [Saccoglossus kowalevskii]|uniref:PRA1 family protein n=1 Tax=Saccoglossus kowalevskii TaxID=10224 RepID=A0ABM0GLG2_SACKO|nr:PREDICTED: PRA1 family protein 3-like [Saccoglossus kowalevskii]
MDDIQVPPLRAFKDFLGESARFQTPAFNDLMRWNNRVVNNLLYYQTNYFLVTVVMFLIVGCLHPVKMLIGIVAVIAAFMGFIMATENKRQMKNFKQAHPLICVLAILAIGYFIVYVFGGLLVFIWGIALPLAVIFLHASFKLRNIKNKVSYGAKSFGLKRTPMGVLLTALGQEQEARS